MASAARRPPAAPQLLTETTFPGPDGAAVRFGRYKAEQPLADPIALQSEGAPILFCASLRGFETAVMWRNGRAIRRSPVRAGSISVWDFAEDWACQLPEPHDTLHLWLPRESLADLDRGEGGGSITERLRFDPATDHRDPALFHLISALAPCLEEDGHTSSLFRHHVLEAIRLRLTEACGSEAPHGRGPRAGLSAAQERRVKERLMADLADDPGLAELAALCGLSTSHFARAFRRSTGLPPHQWLLAQRICKAKQLLAGAAAPISEIALACGFADQSHLTRVFSKAVGASPAAWRRDRRR